jgi:TPR repeat protein
MADPTVFCVRCAADVSALPPAARFCSRCGFHLLRPFLRAHASLPPTGSPPVCSAFQPPLILVAYARALFNLGWRYETAVGSRRNAEEAARCYGKAARLGDAAALARLHPEPHADPPPLAHIYEPPVG